MKRIALALLLSGLALPALAADNAVIVTPGSGVTMRSRDTTGAGGPQSMITILGDTGGNPSGVFANYGTSPGSVLVPAMNAFVTNTPAVSQSGSWSIVNISGTVSLPTGASTSALQPTVNAFAGTTSAGTTGPLMFGAVTTGAPAYTTGNNNPFSLDTVGNLRVNCITGCSAASNISQIAGVTLGASAVVNYGSTPAASAVPGVNAFVTNSNPNGRTTSSSSSPVVPSAAPTTFHLIAANSTNATSVKGSAATLMSCQTSNNSTTPAYLKIFNKASAPTLGTDTPVDTLIIPGPAAGGGGSNVVFGPGGLALGTGFALAVTNLIADADSTAVAAATYAINCQYE
jgi:hypothetical protein